MKNIYAVLSAAVHIGISAGSIRRKVSLGVMDKYIDQLDWDLGQSRRGSRSGIVNDRRVQPFVYSKYVESAE